ncbi:hypothetical protein DID88_004819 [Monilinia fructigena]|uniref:Ribosomal protein S11 n=1 Tax=Monilinia fructigena TaxID=38457 RepID=A0A395IV77_9HELO|nr:hypothetical protein DID88_004819 [Monilinia fructigena]
MLQRKQSAQRKRTSTLAPVSGKVNSFSVSPVFSHLSTIPSSMSLIFLAAKPSAVSPELGITALHIKIRATGGNGTKTPGPGAQSALRALARTGMKIGRIEDVTPTPSDSTRRKGGRRGRRL